MYEQPACKVVGVVAKDYQHVVSWDPFYKQVMDFFITPEFAEFSKDQEVTSEFLQKASLLLTGYVNNEIRTDGKFWRALIYQARLETSPDGEQVFKVMIFIETQPDSLEDPVEIITQKP